MSSKGAGKLAKQDFLTQIRNEFAEIDGSGKMWEALDCIFDHPVATVHDVQAGHVIRSSWRMEDRILKRTCKRSAKSLAQIYDSRGSISGLPACCDGHTKIFSEAFSAYSDFSEIRIHDLVGLFSNFNFKNSFLHQDQSHFDRNEHITMSVFKRFKYVSDLMGIDFDASKDLSDQEDANPRLKDLRGTLRQPRSSPRMRRIRSWQGAQELDGIFGQAPGARKQPDNKRCRRQKVFCTPSKFVDDFHAEGETTEGMLSMLGVPFDAKQEWVEVRFNLKAALSGQWVDAELPRRDWKVATPTILDAGHWMYWPYQQDGLNRTRDIRSDDPGLIELIVAPFSTAAIVDMRLWPKTRADHTKSMSGCYRCATYARPCPKC